MRIVFVWMIPLASQFPCFEIGASEQNTLILTNLSSYFENLYRVAASDFFPTDRDILRARVRTHGITETVLILNEIAYTIYDVGQERRKWAHVLENVDVFFFCVNISGYDLPSYYSRNDMQDALLVFEAICNTRWFRATSIILLFTKIDLLQRKLARSPFNGCFPGFKGDPTSSEDVKAYILMRFLKLNRRSEKKIDVYFDDIVSNPDSGKLAFAAIDKCISDREAKGVEWKL